MKTVPTSFVRALSALILALSPLTAAHAKIIEELPDNWIIDEDEKACSLIKRLTDGRLLVLKYNGSLNKVRLALTITVAESIKNLDQKDIRMIFVDGHDGLDEGWGEQTFYFARGDGNQVAMYGYFAAHELLYDVSRHAIFGFFYKDRLIDSIPLDGSSKGVAKLRECAGRRMLASPTDPFVDWAD